MSFEHCWKIRSQVSLTNKPELIPRAAEQPGANWGRPGSGGVGNDDVPPRETTLSLFLQRSGLCKQTRSGHPSVPAAVTYNDRECSPVWMTCSSSPCRVRLSLKGSRRAALFRCAWYPSLLPLLVGLFFLTGSSFQVVQVGLTQHLQPPKGPGWAKPSPWS